MSQGTNGAPEAAIPINGQEESHPVTVRDFATEETQKTPPGKILTNQSVSPPDETCDTRASSPALPEHIASQPLPSYQTTPRGCFGSGRDEESSRKYRKPENCPPTPGPPPDRPTPKPKSKGKIVGKGSSNGNAISNKSRRVKSNGTAIAPKDYVHVTPSHANKTSAISPGHTDKALEAYRHLQQADPDSEARQDEMNQDESRLPPLPDHLRRSRTYSPMPKLEIHQPTLGPMLALRSVNCNDIPVASQEAHAPEANTHARRGLFDSFKRPGKFVQRLREVSDSITRRAEWFERIERIDRPQRPRAPDLFERNVLHNKQSLPVLPLYEATMSEEPGKIESFLFEPEFEPFHTHKDLGSAIARKAVAPKSSEEDLMVNSAPRSVKDPVIKARRDPSHYFSSHSGLSTEELHQLVGRITEPPKQSQQERNGDVYDLHLDGAGRCVSFETIQDSDGQAALAGLPGEPCLANTPPTCQEARSSFLVPKVSDFSETSSKQPAQPQDYRLRGTCSVPELPSLGSQPLEQEFADLPPISPTKKGSVPRPLRVGSKSSTKTNKEATSVPQAVFDTTDELSKLVAEMSGGSGSSSGTAENSEARSSKNMARFSPKDETIVISSTPPKGPLSHRQLALQNAAERGLRHMAERSEYLQVIRNVQASTSTSPKESPEATPRASQAPQALERGLDDGTTPRAVRNPKHALIAGDAPDTPTPVGRASRPVTRSQQNLKARQPRKTAWYNSATGMIETQSGIIPPLTTNPAIQAAYEKFVGISGPPAFHMRDNKTRDQRNPSSYVVTSDFSDPMLQIVAGPSHRNPIIGRNNYFALAPSTDAEADVFGPGMTITSSISPRQPQPVRPWEPAAGSSFGFSQWVVDGLEDDGNQDGIENQENNPVFEHEIEYNPWR